MAINRGGYLSFCQLSYDAVVDSSDYMTSNGRMVCMC